MGRTAKYQREQIKRGGPDLHDDASLNSGQPRAADGIFMQRRLSIALVVTLLPAVFLWLWKLTFNFSDLAAIWLLCLAVMIFLGNWSITVNRWKAERGIVLRSGSWLAGWLTGRIGAFLSSTLLVLLLVPALAWNALTMSGVEVVVSLAVVFA